MKVLVADDHSLVRDGLAGVLRQFDATAEVVHAADAGQVITLVNEQDDFDLFLIDLFMPGGNGIRLVGKLCDMHPDIPLVVISASEDLRHMQQVIDLGASGYIPKTTVRSVLLGALHLVLSGGVYIPPHMLNMANLHENSNSPGNMSGAVGANGPGGLTDRQKEVLHLVAKGKTNRQIATDLSLSENTVKSHVAAIMRALGVNNRTQIVASIRAGST